MALTFADTVEPERVRWLWPGYIPFGKVTVIDGDPGLGKSTIMIDIAARLSRGQPLPNGKQHQVMGTVLLMGEDGAGDTIVPRLMNAEADLRRIGLRGNYQNDKGKDIPPSFPSNLTDLKEDIIEARAGLVVIDPVMSYLDPDINSNNDQQVRRALMPLAQLAEETGAAIVLLRHLNKSTTGSALYRGGGSIGFVGVSRSALILARDPDEPGRVVLASTKSNLGPPPPSLHFRLEGCPNGAAKIAWEGLSAYTADTLMQEQGNEDRGTALDEAVAFLRELLASGPELSTLVQRSARDAGLAWDTVRRAQRKLKIVPQKAKTQDGKWTWGLPAEDVHPPDTPTFNNNNNNNNFEGYSEDVEGVEGNEDADRKKGHTFASQFPIAAFSGRGVQCSVCGDPMFAREGKPLVCKYCLSSGVLATAD
jgi:putative DNA primase/helicase